MANLPKKLPFDFTSIRGINNIEDMKQWLEHFSRDFDKLWVLMMDTFIGKTVAESRNWRLIEDGDDLIVQRKVGGTWTDADKIHGS